MATAVTSPVTAQGHCSQCGKIWTLETRQGVCQWCGKLATCQTNRAKPHQIKSSRRRRQKQADHNGNGYDQLEGVYATYYKIASRFNRKAKIEDREDLLHTIILTLAVTEQKNGDKPFTIGTMHRIASRCVADYWRDHYNTTNGLNCGACSQKQRAQCREDDLYGNCPKAIKVESLNQPIIDSEGNITELGELIADPNSLDLDAWDRDSLWQIGYKPRLVDIAYKLHRGEALTATDSQYLWRYRQQAQKRLRGM